MKRKYNFGVSHLNKSESRTSGDPAKWQVLKAVLEKKNSC